MFMARNDCHAKYRCINSTKMFSFLRYRCFTVKHPFFSILSVSVYQIRANRACETLASKIINTVAEGSKNLTILDLLKRKQNDDNLASIKYQISNGKNVVQVHPAKLHDILCELVDSERTDSMISLLPLRWLLQRDQPPTCPNDGMV